MMGSASWMMGIWGWYSSDGECGETARELPRWASLAFSGSEGWFYHWRQVKPSEAEQGGTLLDGGCGGLDGDGG